jgi:hypothetical protein
MSEAYDVPESRCPECGKLNDAASGISNDTPPSPGNVAICFYCHHLAIYGEDMKLRHPTDEEVVEIAGDPDIVHAMTMLGKFKQWEERNAAQTPTDNRAPRRARRKPGKSDVEHRGVRQWRADR